MIVKQKRVRDNCKSLFCCSLIGEPKEELAILPTIYFVKRLQHYERIQKALTKENGKDFGVITMNYRAFVVQGLLEKGVNYSFLSDNNLFSIPNYGTFNTIIEIVFYDKGFKFITGLYERTSKMIPYETFTL